MNKNTGLTEETISKLLTILEARFGKHMGRHKGLTWQNVRDRLLANPRKLWSINAMEETGGEPDVVGQDNKTGEYIFYDCSPESPTGRRSLCYDNEALESRKANKPRNSALGLADEMDIRLLTESEYRSLHELGNFDNKTSSWIATPADIREKGGALFCDFRFGHVFVYHNGAESYYAARGFRGIVKV